MPGKVRLPSVGAARKMEAPGDKIAAMLAFDDDHGRFAWKVTAESAIYAARTARRDRRRHRERRPGPALGLQLRARPVRDLGRNRRRSVRRADAGRRAWSFRRPLIGSSRLGRAPGTSAATVRRTTGTFASETYLPVPVSDGVISLSALADEGKVLAENVGATLYDMGDGVGCVAFHTKMNAIDSTILEMIATGCDMVDAGELVGLVVGNEATNFSVGANVGLIGMLAMSQDWDQVAEAVRVIQETFKRMKYCDGPVVIAPRGHGARRRMRGRDARRCRAGISGVVHRPRRTRRRVDPGGWRLQGDGVPVLRFDPGGREGRSVPVHGEGVHDGRHRHGRDQRRGSAGPMASCAGPTGSP